MYGCAWLGQKQTWNFFCSSHFYLNIGTIWPEQPLRSSSYQKPTHTPTSHQATKQPSNQPTSHPNSVAHKPNNPQPTKQPKEPTANQPTRQVVLHIPGGGGGSITWNPLGGGGKASHPTAPHSTTLDGAVVQPTPQSHTTGRREGVTHLPFNVCPWHSHFKNAFGENSHTCKKKPIPSLTLGARSRLAPAPTPQHGPGGGGVIAQHSGGVCAVFVFGL